MTSTRFKISREFILSEIEKAINFTISYGGDNILKRCDYDSLIRNKDEIMNCLKKDLK